MPTKKERLDALEADLRTLSEDIDAVGDRLTLRDNRHTERHDQAMEIVGTRIGELVERLDKLEQTLSAPFFQTREQPVFSQATDTRYYGGPANGDMAGVKPVPFPTGAATTVDDALAAVPPVDDSPPFRAFASGGSGGYLPALEEAITAMVPPVDDGPPRRGDRVRLEGARDHMGRRITDGWYEVVGHDDIPSFQITTRESTSRDELGAWMPWLRPSDSLKEIRRAAVSVNTPTSTPPTPRSPIEPEDGLDV